MATGEARRRRRSPGQARDEIIAAAEALLRERPFRELTIDELMRRTDMSRPSFYVYFRDRHHLVLCVVEHLEEELMAVSRIWFESDGQGVALIEEAMRDVVGVYERHGPVLRALADAASDDPGVEQAYRDFVTRFVDATASHLEHELEQGSVTDLDPRLTAAALIHMNERYLGVTLGREPFADPEEVVATVTRIWTRTLYGR